MQSLYINKCVFTIKFCSTKYRKLSLLLSYLDGMTIKVNSITMMMREHALMG
jgi:hypothetical protein